VEKEQDRTEMTSNIDDRTMHELYLWPFADAVKANVASVMCSYNKLNTTWACESGRLLNGLLKEELEFKGYVVSDWDAQHTTAGSARAGMDMAMPGDDFHGQKNFLWADKLANAIPGQVPLARLDDMVRRILAAFYYLGQDKGYPKLTFNSWKNGTGGPDVQGDHKTVARAVARDGIVLLKNDGSGRKGSGPVLKNDGRVLPLNGRKTLAIIGEDAFNNPKGPNACADRGCNTGTLAMGWGSGTAEFPVRSLLESASDR
jgi:beta-glucosidase